MHFATINGEWELTPKGVCFIEDDGGSAAASGGDGAEGIDGLTGDNPLDILNPQSVEDEATGEGELNADGSPKEPAKPAPAGMTEAERESFNKMEERSIAAQQEATYLRGQVATLVQQLNASGKKDTPPPKEEPLFTLPTKEELLKAFEQPEGAVNKIYEMFQNLGNAIEKRVKGLDEGTRAELAQRDARSRNDAAYRADGAKAIEEFGKDLLSDPEFIAEGDKVIEDIIKLRGGDRYLPGDFYTAASRVHANWQRNGKLAARGNGNGNNNANGSASSAARPSLREVARQVPASDDLGNRRPAGGGNGNGAAKTLKDLGLSPTEERVARITMRRLNVSEANFVANTLAARREDPDFGK